MVEEAGHDAENMAVAERLVPGNPRKRSFPWELRPRKPSGSRYLSLSRCEFPIRSRFRPSSRQASDFPAGAADRMATLAGQGFPARILGRQLDLGCRRQRRPMPGAGPALRRLARPGVQMRLLGVVQPTALS
jgi:hypothetical protein